MQGIKGASAQRALDFVVALRGREARDVNLRPLPIARCSADCSRSPLLRISRSWTLCTKIPPLIAATVYLQKDILSCMEDNKEQGQMDVNISDESSMPSSQKQEEVIKKKYGGLLPKKQPLISKDHERAYFDSADWALGKQGGEKPKGPLEALRPKLQPTQQQTRYRKSPCAPAVEGGSVPSEDAPSSE
ncbi:cAMP-regulated phosphoprotein-like protein [Senna tora]|uniref:cAMP-regulated phosphoprotein-like protein n=1 Tax=Senna tora TaxID=362788 RepID=A0A834TJN0_9FABA|nr:cAMP-regulated phosphoprotein-like protein [Senna tora]